jgi:YidC/Oxa1 family membrane protein insertase
MSTILVAGAAFLAVYYGSQYFFGDRTPHATDSVAPDESALSPEETAAREADARSHAVARLDRFEEATITTDEFEASIDNLGGGLTHFLLLGERFHDSEGGAQDLVTTDDEHYRPMRISLPGAPIPSDAIWDMRQISPTQIELRWAGQGLEIVRSISAGSAPYQLWQTVVVRNVGTASRRTPLYEHTYHYVEVSSEGGGMFGGRSPQISQGLCRADGDVVRKDHDALLNAHGYGGGVDFTGIENVYFVQALAPSASEAAHRCGMVASHRGDDGSGSPVGNLFESTLEYETVEIPAGGEHTWTTLAYLGPKDWHALEVAGHHLPDVVNLGTFAIIARFFGSILGWLYAHVGNWGIAIIILTMMVKILLFPVVNRQFRAMAPMRKLKPEMDAINEKYRDDMEQRQREIMLLYQKHGINPASQMLGCLPVFLQMPVFFALYASLQNNIELYHQPFILFWTDLTARDPYFVLPVALSGLMFVQQKLMPNTGMDPQQAKIMLYMMPLMMGTFMLFLPSGLCLYMLTNSALSIAQQQFNFWRASQEDTRNANLTPALAAAAPAEKASTSTKKGSGRDRRG